MAGYSKAAQKYISHKIEKLRGEGKTQRQAVGAAMGMARSEGYDVPTVKTHKYSKPHKRRSY